MLSSRGGLGRIARRSMGFARRMFSLPDEAEIPETRSDGEHFAEDYQRLADAARGNQKGAAVGAAPFRETQRYAVNASGRGSRS